MNAVSVNVNDIDWQPTTSYPGDAQEKVLSTGGSVAPRTILLKLPPGWSMDRHSHAQTELHYVLEGEYEIGDKTFPAGTFRMIPKEVEHGPFTTRSGAVILVVWCRTNE